MKESAPAATVRPTADDPVVRGMSEAVGGPPGRHVSGRGHPFWSPLRVLLALALVVLAAAWVQKAPCRDHVWAHEYQYTHACYTDVFALYFAEGLDKGEVPYFGHAVEYPVLTGAVMGVIGWPARALDRTHPARTFFDLTALLLAGAALVTGWALARLHRSRPWDAAMFALAPAMVVTAFVNWDLVAVALATVALLAWARRRLVWAGIALGLAVAAKFYPLLFLGPMFLLCLRADVAGFRLARPRLSRLAAARSLRAFVLTAATAFFTWLAVNLPVAIFARESWSRFFVLSRDRGADWGTFWYWLQHVMSRPLDHGLAAGKAPGLLNLGVTVALVIGCIGIALLALLAPRRPRLGQLLFLVVAVFLVTGKVWSQQYVLWLIPLAVLARPRWGAFLAWQACELAYFFAFYYELTGAARGAPVIPEWLFLIAAGLRAGGLLMFCGLVIIDVLWPAGDPVRVDGDDDPAGGVLNGAPDAPVLAGRELVPAAGRELTARGQW